ncbi:MAG: CvpA family protein [Chthoniobacterales bacterium]
MTPAPDAANASMLWQAVFVSFGVALIFFEFIRGWRVGLMRQLVRVFAIIVAYAAAIYGGKLLVPILRPFLRMPDLVAAILAGSLLAILIYSVISNLGRILFKRTAQHVSAPLRIFSGASGAVVGIIFGVFLLWLVLVGVRSVGAIADGQVHALATSAPEAVHAVYSPDNNDLALKREKPFPLFALLARLKNSVELGAVGEVVKRTDIVSPTRYDTLAKVGEVISTPTAAERFLSFPGAHELSENPKIIALREDTHIPDLIAQHRFFDLLQNDKVLEAVNDPTLARQIQNFDWNGALDYALKEKQPRPDTNEHESQ